MVESNGRVVARDAFDVYVTTLQDTNKLNERRRQLDSLYVTLITFILGGEAYVAFNSTFTNWLPALAATGVSLVGIAVNARWRDGLRSIDQILDHRYQFLRKLEDSDLFRNIGATLFTDEWREIYSKRIDRKFKSVTGRLQSTFTTVFVLIPLAVTALTAVDTVPLLHSAIPAPILQYIQPLPAPVTRP